MLSARTSKIAIKVMPTGSRVAAARTARRLNCRSRSSLVLNMADRRASWAAAYRAAPHFAIRPSLQLANCSRKKEGAPDLVTKKPLVPLKCAKHFD